MNFILCLITESNESQVYAAKKELSPKKKQSPKKNHSPKKKQSAKKKQSPTKREASEEKELEEVWKQKNRSANSQSILEPEKRKLRTRK